MEKILSLMVSKSKSQIQIKKRMNIIAEIKERAMAPTPLFFEWIKKIGLLIAAIGLGVLTAPGEIPEVILTYAEHALTAGTILVSICQLTVDEKALEERILQSIE